MILPNLTTLEPQVGKLGRPFRASGVQKITTIAPKWVNRVEKYCWRHTFRYLDEKGGFFEIDLDHENNLIDKRNL
jgi:phage terminase small subunit